jgi:hypothetical protein
MTRARPTHSPSSATTKVIRFAHRIAGVLTDATSVTLNDDTATYGVRRVDTGAVVVAAGTAFTHDGTGLYSYTLTGLTAGVTYQFSVEKVYAGETKRWAGTFTLSGNAAGFWTTQAQVEQEFGVTNCAEDVDLNNTGAGTAAVWQQALNWVDSLIDRIFAQAGYARPTDLTSTDYMLVSGYAASMVRNEIHGGRGSTETNGAGGPATGGVFQKDADEAEAAIREMAEDGVSFPEIFDPAGQAQGNAPVILRPTIDEEGRAVAVAADYQRPYWDGNSKADPSRRSVSGLWCSPQPSMETEIPIEPPELPTLYPKQAEAILCPARYTVIEATTKAGKTAGCLIWLLAKAWNEGQDGRSYWWIAPVFAQAKVAFRRLRQMLQSSDPRGITWAANDTELRIELANGSAVWFKGSDNPDSLYGDDVYAGVMDEASRCKEEAWHAVRSTLTATGGPIKIIGNVHGRKNWAYQLARKAEAGEQGFAYFKLTAWDAVEGGILNAAEIEDARQVLPEAVFRELYLAEPSDDGGNPFGIDAIRDCSAGFTLSNGPALCWGVDLAKSHDWTVAVALDAEARVCQLERWQSDWGQTRRRLLDMIGDTPALIDSTGVGDPIVEDMQRERMGVEGFKFNSAPEGMHDDGVCALALAREAWERQTHERAEMAEGGFVLTAGGGNE